MWRFRAVLAALAALVVLALAPQVPVRTVVETFPLAEANEAVARLRSGRIRGAAVLLPGTQPDAGVTGLLGGPTPSPSGQRGAS